MNTEYETEYAARSGTWLQCCDVLKQAEYFQYRGFCELEILRISVFKIHEKCPASYFSFLFLFPSSYLVDISIPLPDTSYS
jgi:hypothetical protein